MLAQQMLSPQLPFYETKIIRNTIHVLHQNFDPLCVEFNQVVVLSGSLGGTCSLEVWGLSHVICHISITKYI